jgi:hypothetical protein
MPSTLDDREGRIVTELNTVPCLALRPREAAKAIGISERTLSTWTKERGVPHFKLNGTVLYPTRELTDWITAQLPEGDSYAE